MTQWNGEVIVRKQGKSYTLPSVFVSVEASNYAAAVGAAVRKAKGKLPKGVRVEHIMVKVDRCASGKEVKWCTPDESAGANR